MSASTLMEFAVQMKCDGCAKTVRKALEGVDGIKSVQINVENEQVIVEGTLPSNSVKNLIEATGKLAVLQGYGSSTETRPKLTAAAVAMLEAGNPSIKGVVRFVQTDEDTCVVDGTVDGLPPGKHGLFIHECGDISNGCHSCGDIFGNMGPLTKKVAGAMGDIVVHPNGRSEFHMINKNVKVWDMIGRSMIIHEEDTDARIQNKIENRLTCGIIARSAGVSENNKKICSCDGVTLWDERNVPLAGEGRQSKM
ncbi:copper chaperone for superoxide dismutase-like [Mizuhopecten yessoensis]|uniref:Superoxide dismutase copper chaperone n=1 Tax=Mizuhopecten yessoensis TaxID=6573 RepID=A0A210Q9P1_MIZYE|nr:copper chaperone for superoxide dismutase-like [Mizuhopecten yessoensis]OWF45460.1 Copper chaperone for superoxide dismutase [Mizuhopecten yessoensis]